ncbi:MAG TPA: GNAT family N-acetyltransferase [Thermoanaerobaculia bacterium]|nr:GNAT family N-acetyltransferase [Thermoanaerobaculia bacterium]
MPSPLRVRRHSAPSSFLAAAREWLLEREAENNVVLGVAEKLAAGDHDFEPPLYLATVHDAEGRVTGCAFRTPPFKLGLCRMPAEAVPRLVDDVAAVYASLPAVMGPEPVVDAFAAGWTRLRGGSSRMAMRMRAFELRAVVWPERPAPGRMRIATAADEELVVRWVRAFEADAGLPLSGGPRRAEELTAEGAVALWEDAGEPVSMAGRMARTPSGYRIGAVYTPRELRGRGYASHLVAAYSQHLLDGGATACFLFTDLANPTSNAIYQQVGYRPTGDLVERVFTSA